MRLLYGIVENAKAFSSGMKTKINIKEVGKMIQEQKQLDAERKLLINLKKIAQTGIYVGIPQEYSERKEKGMNNASLLYIHTHGSPVAGIPPRPLIEPAIEDTINSQKIADDLGEISRAIIDGDYVRAEKLMSVTGQDAVNMIDDWFEDPKNGWPPDAPATVKAKMRKTGKSLSKRKKMYADYEAGLGGNQVLVDTGQLRRSITYVVGDKVFPPKKGKK